MSISWSNEDKFKLKIDEKIDLSEFIERYDVSKVHYQLVGAIFIERNEEESKKYVSITKRETAIGFIIKERLFNILLLII